MFVDVRFGELGELSEFALGESVRGRAPIRPSLGKLAQLRRQAVLRARATRPLPVSAQKLRLFSGSFIGPGIIDPMKK
jgi:hypothetical protein